MRILSYLKGLLVALIISSVIVSVILANLILENGTNSLLIILLLSLYSIILFNNLQKYKQREFFRNSLSLTTGYTILHNIQEKSNFKLEGRYQVKIFESDAVEAEIDNKGNIFVSKTLFKKDIKIVESVVAHELAHDILGHTLTNKRMYSLFFVIYNLIFLIFLQYVTLTFINYNSGNSTNSTISLTVISLVVLYMFSFMLGLKGLRELEFEADLKASEWGYAENLIKLFEESSVQENKYTIFSTHPATFTRIKKLKSN